MCSGSQTNLWQGSSTMGAEPLLSPVIAIATRTGPGEGSWHQQGLICRRRRSRAIDDCLGKLQKVVNIGEIRRQPNRYAECPLLAIVNDVEKLLIRHTPFLAKARSALPEMEEQNGR